jgi:hypothetical protein
MTNPSLDLGCVHELFGYFVWNEQRRAYDLWHKCPKCGLREHCNHNEHPMYDFSDRKRLSQ